MLILKLVILTMKCIFPLKLCPSAAYALRGKNEQKVNLLHNGLDGNNSTTSTASHIVLI